MTTHLVKSRIPATGSCRKIVGFGSRNTIPISGDRLCPGSLQKRKKPIIEFEHHVSASMFQPVLEFSARNRPVRFDLGMHEKVQIIPSIFLFDFDTSIKLITNNKSDFISKCQSLLTFYENIDLFNSKCFSTTYFNSHCCNNCPFFYSIKSNKRRKMYEHVLCLLLKNSFQRG